MLHQFGRLETPLSMDQGKGAAKSSPEDTTEMDNVLQSLSSHKNSAQKIDIMQQAFERCTKVSISCKVVKL